MIKYSSAEMAQKIKDKYPNLTLVECSYVNTKTMCDFIDVTFGVFQAKPESLLREQHCGQHPLMPKSKRRTQIKLRQPRKTKVKPLTAQQIYQKYSLTYQSSQEDVARIINQIYPYIIMTSVSNSFSWSSYCVFRDDEFGEFTSIPRDLISGNRLGHPKRTRQSSAKKRSKPIESVIKQLAEINPELEIIADTYRGTGVKCTFLDKDYGTFETKPYLILSGNQKGHPERFRDKLRQQHTKPFAQFQQELQKLYPNLTCIEETYTNCHAVTQFVDSKYGEFECRPQDLLQGKQRGHPARPISSSIGEKDLKQWVDTLVESVKYRKKRQEIDIYIPSLSLGIEFNGVYYHTSEFKDKHYHSGKTKYFAKLGIRIIHIWEPEWLLRKQQVQSFLRSALQKNQHKLNVRDCQIIWSADSKEILKAHNLIEDCHIQKPNKSTLYVANVYYKDELMATATFGRHHRNLNSWVLTRFVTKTDYTIRGLLGKISKIAVNELKQDIITWADLRLSDGNGYIKAGWLHEKTLPPDYMYTDSRRIFSKQSRQKKIIGTPEGMTEAQHAKLDNLKVIYDCGKIRFRYPYMKQGKQ